MAIYAIYSYEIQEGSKSLFYKETGVKAINMANEIVSNLLNDGLTIVGKKREEEQILKCIHFTGRENVFSWELCNNKDLIKYEGHQKFTEESHPGSYVIVDNRPNVCQIAIEKNSAFGPDTDKVVKYLKQAFRCHLYDYGLKMVIKRKWQAKNFKDIIRERLLKNNDYIKRVVWEFPNPEKVKGIDTSQHMRKKLEGLRLLITATNALKGKLMLSGSKNNHINVDEEQIEDWAQIIALSAQNNYKLSYYFYNSPVVNFKDVAYAFATISNKLIRDFETGQLIDNGEGTTFELIESLDEIRRNIADYDNEKIIDD